MPYSTYLNNCVQQINLEQYENIPINNDIYENQHVVQLNSMDINCKVVNQVMI
ncbi:unnamed protein product [Schistosoma mattheei]|uniref:Uncharacterized protein n=1 Tax=Schistosoma mattheei TaxID=31246 RepID=A0A183PYI3_9TREM|nr:unnamed protein product [Schistosoma mattheei]